jgi:2-polyprenyl-3-methyl-5-hydroxy-6-metoxy-1,4-benzoquinol methylase
MTEELIDPKVLMERARGVRDIASNFYTSLLIYLGRRLGLYDALASCGFVTSDELAASTGLHERWLREWLRQQTSAGLLDYKDGRFRLSPELHAVLADDEHMVYLGYIFDSIPHRIETIERLPEAFRTGIGLAWDDRGAMSMQFTEMLFRNWYRNVLINGALPRLDGVVERLAAGGRAADIGCGSGVAVLEMARAFPLSEFHGYELSKLQLERAAANRQAAGVTNAHFHDVAVDPLPADASFDLITCFDTLHDMTHPDQVAAAIRAAIKPDGVWFIVDIDGGATFEENLDRPGSQMFYAMSILSCMSSALSEPGGAGLGTLGLPEPAMRELTEQAGFTRFRRIDLPHPVNAFYEARP